MLHKVNLLITMRARCKVITYIDGETDNKNTIEYPKL